MLAHHAREEQPVQWAPISRARRARRDADPADQARLSMTAGSRNANAPINGPPPRHRVERKRRRRPMSSMSIQPVPARPPKWSTMTSPLLACTSTVTGSRSVSVSHASTTPT